MAKKQRNEIRAGIFALAVILLLLGVILWMGAADLFEPSGQKVVFFAPSSAGMLGITEGAGVNINDARVGKVVEVRFDPSRGGTWYICRLQRTDLSISADAKAEVIAPFIGQPTIVISDTGSDRREESVALADSRDRAISLGVGGFMGTLEMASKQIAQELDASEKTSLMAGVKSIVSQLEGAADNVQAVSAVALAQTDPKLADSLLYKIGQSLDDLNALTGRLVLQTNPQVDGTLLAKVHLALDDLNRTMASIAHQTDPAQAQALISKVHRTMDDVNAMTGTIRPDVTQMVKSGRASMSKIEQYISTDLAEILTVIKDTNNRINRVAKDFNALSGDARELLAVNRVSINEMVDDMAAGGEAFRAAIEELRRAPWKLLHKPDKGKMRTTDIYNAAVSFAAGAEQLDQALARMQKLSEAHPEGIPEDNAQLQQVRTHLEEVFRKFRVAEKALWKELEDQAR